MVWNFQWRINLFAWEAALLNDLYQIFTTTNLVHEEEDRVLWQFHKSGVCSVKSFEKAVWKSISQHQGVSCYSIALLRAFGRGWFPSKVELFSWFVLVGRVSTKDRLAKMNIPSVHDSNCVLCSGHEESLQHLFFTCNYAWRLWRYWLLKWDAMWVPPNDSRLSFELWMSTKLQIIEERLDGCFLCDYMDDLTMRKQNYT